jgi:triosephosphate isomerase
MHRINKLVSIHRSIEVVIAPSFLTLQPLSLDIDRRKFKLASQDGYFEDEGPYTGEVSFTMLHGIVDYAIIGHSARRIYFNESLDMIRDKTAAAVRNKIIPILCIGETKPERVSGKTKQVIHDQLTSAISNLTSAEVSKMVIAYEPVWAISTFDGEIARPDVIQRELDYVRYQISELFGAKLAKEVRVLYGGSVNRDDASSYLALDGCDGALVGGASLNYQEFADIINKAYLVKHRVN